MEGEDIPFVISLSHPANSEIPDTAALGHCFICELIPFHCVGCSWAIRQSHRANKSRGCQRHAESVTPSRPVGGKPERGAMNKEPFCSFNRGCQATMLTIGVCRDHIRPEYLLVAAGMVRKNAVVV